MLTPTQVLPHMHSSKNDYDWFIFIGSFSKELILKGCGMLSPQGYLQKPVTTT
jgi:hypothetical protein